MMRNSVLPLILCALLLAACTAGGKKPAASPKEVLSERLAAYAAEGKVLYGHQDDLSYGRIGMHRPDDAQIVKGCGKPLDGAADGRQSPGNVFAAVSGQQNKAAGGQLLAAKSGI